MLDPRERLVESNKDIIAIAQKARSGEPVPPGYIYRSDVHAVSSLSDGRMVILDDQRRPETPILVDMKITEVCRAGCPYCYMSSTQGGKHAKLSTIKTFINSFGEYPPLLVTLGGGEPTEHPHFVQIVKWLSDRNIIVTASVGRASRIEVVRQAIPYLKRIGVSVSPGSLKPIKDILSVCAGKAVLHVPLFPEVVRGAVTLLREFAASGHNPLVAILALAPHNVGRGEKYSAVTHREIATAIKTLVVYARELGIEFAGNPCWTNRNAGILEEVDMRCSGGQWSMAYDAIRMTMSRCSYLFDEQEQGTNVCDWWGRQTLVTECALELPTIPELHTQEGTPLLPDCVHNLPLPPELLVTHFLCGRTIKKGGICGKL